MRRLVLLCFLLLAAAALPGAATHAHGQPTGGLNATATILFPPLTGAGVRPLQFGALVPGASRAVLPSPTVPGVGEFRITGMRNRRGLAITITLPDSLRNAAGQGMGISFNGNYAAACEIETAGTCDQVTYVAWNPVTTPTFIDTPTRSRPGRPRYDLDQFSVYMGGVAQTRPTQPAGTYNANILVTLIPN